MFRVFFLLINSDCTYVTIIDKTCNIIVSFILKIHLLQKAVYKIALSKRSQCMYSIYN